MREKLLSFWDAFVTRVCHAPAVVLVCEGYFTLYLLMASLYAAICPPAAFAYDLSLLRVVLGSAGAACSLWLLAKRRRDARWVVPATATLSLLLCAIDALGFGTLQSSAKIVGMPIAFGIMLAELLGSFCVGLLMIRNQTLREAMNVERDLEPAHDGGHSWDRPMRERMRTWEFWRDLGVYFIVFSFLGHWAEMLFCRLIVVGVFMGDYDPTNAMLWEQWLFPFSAEGLALAAVVLVLHPFANALQKRFGTRSPLPLLLSFLANGALCTSIDFLTGITCNLDCHLWDYRKMPFNFMGQVCLQNSLVYTIAATIIVWLVYPALDAGIRRLSKSEADGIFWGLFGAYLFLALLHFVDPSLM